MSGPKRKKYSLCASEMEYINKYLLRYGKVKIRKHQNVPELILNQYEQHLIDRCKDYGHNTGEQRLKVIKDYVDYVVNIEARYKRLLKLHKLKGYQVGLMLDYKNQRTWHKSYKRYTYIRFLVTMIDKHEELLERLNSGK